MIFSIVTITDWPITQDSHQPEHKVLLWKRDKILLVSQLNAIFGEYANAANFQQNMTQQVSWSCQHLSLFSKNLRTI